MRTPSEIRQHYEVERELADKLRNAPRTERAALYGKVYDELFKRVPTHPQHTRKHDPAERSVAVEERMSLLRQFLGPDSVFLEIGAGDGHLTRAAARHAKMSYGLDVSREMFDGKPAANMEMLLSDGCSIPLPPGSVTVAYSYQVMEHIHPDDALEQLRNIFTVLAPGGMYLCVTPNRLNGPHDVSQFFDLEARGFHLKEYTVTELDRLFRQVGFARTEPFIGFRHRYVSVPIFVLRVIEGAMALMPGRFRRWLGNLRGIQNLLFISLRAVK